MFFKRILQFPCLNFSFKENEVCETSNISKNDPKATCPEVKFKCGKVLNYGERCFRKLDVIAEKNANVGEIIECGGCFELDEFRVVKRQCRLIETVSRGMKRLLQVKHYFAT